MSLRCQVCGRIIRNVKFVRKTCCINKLYVFCSEKCRKKWVRSWLKRQI